MIYFQVALNNYYVLIGWGGGADTTIFILLHMSRPMVYDTYKNIQYYVVFIMDKNY